MALETVWLDPPLALNWRGEGVGFEREFVERVEAAFETTLGDVAANDACIFVRKGGRKGNPALAALHKNKRGHGRAVARTAQHPQAARKSQGKADSFFDVSENFAVVPPAFGNRFHGMLLRQPSCRIHAVDAEVH